MLNEELSSLVSTKVSRCHIIRDFFSQKSRNLAILDFENPDEASKILMKKLIKNNFENYYVIKYNADIKSQLIKFVEINLKNNNFQILLNQFLEDFRNKSSKKKSSLINTQKDDFVQPKKFSMYPERIPLFSFNHSRRELEIEKAEFFNNWLHASIENRLNEAPHNYRLNKIYKVYSNPFFKKMKTHYHKNWIL